MKRFVTLVALLTLTLGASVPAFAQSIGHVDMKRVLAESPQGKQIQKKIVNKYEGPRQALIDEEKKIIDAQKVLKRDIDTMSKAQASKKETELKKRIVAFQQRGTAMQQQLFKDQQTLAADVLGPAGKAISAIAKEKKLSMVVEQGTSGLLYLDKSMDLTSEVIKRMK